MTSSAIRQLQPLISRPNSQRSFLDSAYTAKRYSPGISVTRFAGFAVYSALLTVWSALLLLSFFVANFRWYENHLRPHGLSDVRLTQVVVKRHSRNGAVSL